MRAWGSAACGALALLGLAGCGGGTGGGTGAAGEMAEAEAFVTGIYDLYVERDAGGGSASIELYDEAMLRRYVEPSLAALIAADAAAAASSDSASALNGDPFIGAQEWLVTDYTVVVEPAGPGAAAAQVELVNFGQPQRIDLALVRLADGWRIADIDWGGETLRGILTAPPL